MPVPQMPQDLVMLQPTCEAAYRAAVQSETTQGYAQSFETWYKSFVPVPLQSQRVANLLVSCWDAGVQDARGGSVTPPSDQPPSDQPPADNTSCVDHWTSAYTAAAAGAFGLLAGYLIWGRR